MMVNKVNHPAHSKFLAIYEWQIEKYGYSAAVVIAYLEFAGRLSMGGDCKGVAQAKIVGDVAKFTGRDSVSGAIKMLMSSGIVKQFNPPYRSAAQYKLNIDAINSGMESMLSAETSTETSTETKNVYVKVDEKDNNNKEREERSKVNKENIWRKRSSGIVTWTPEDIEMAEIIEESISDDEIRHAVKKIESAGKAALVSRVGREVDDMRQKRATTAAAYQKSKNTQSKLDEIIKQTDAEIGAIKIISNLSLAELITFAEEVAGMVSPEKYSQAANKVKMLILSKEVPKGVGEKDFYDALRKKIEHSGIPKDIVDEQGIGGSNEEKR